MQGGFKIYNVEDFKQFVTDVAADNDLLSEARKEFETFQIIQLMVKAVKEL